MTMKRTLLAAALLLWTMAPALAQYQFDVGGQQAEFSQDAVTNDIILTINGAEKMRVKSDGRLLVQSGLSVADETTCNGPLEGTIRFVSAGNSWRFCDGIAWQNFSVPAGCAVYGPEFDFVNVTNTAKSSVISSNIIQVDTSGCNAQISVTGGNSPQFRICSNAACSVVVQNWTNTPTNIADGQYLQIRQTSSASDNTGTTMTVMAGTVADTWTVTTINSSYTVFVTSVNYDGLALDGIGGADHKCQTLAQAAGLSGRYMAWLTDSATGTSPSNRFHQSTIPYRLVNGVQVAANWTDLVDGTLSAAINLNESGVIVTNTPIITNTLSNGTRNSVTNHCFNYAHVSASSFEFGSNSQISNLWTFTSGTRSCGLMGRLYCFQQPDETIGTPGVDFKRVFITSTTYTGAAVGGTAGADTKCSTLANAAGIGNNYKAWIADGSTNTATSAPNDTNRGFTKATVPYRNVGGGNRKIADNWTDLVDGTLDSGINYNESGTYMTFANVFTNVSPSGTRQSAANHCANWTGTGSAEIGRTGIAAGDWTFMSGTQNCTIAARLLCFEQ